MSQTQDAAGSQYSRPPQDTPTGRGPAMGIIPGHAVVRSPHEGVDISAAAPFVRSARESAMTSLYLDIHELSHLLHIKRATLYAWVAQGKIPHVKIHGCLRFRRDEIEQWLESFRTTPPPQRVRRGPRRRTAPDLDMLIARAKAAVYTPAGETRPRSGPGRKEEKHGAV